MARSIEEIQAQIIAQKENNSVLSSVNSTSNAAYWRLWSRITAVAIWTHENIFDQHKRDIEAIEKQIVPYTAGWWQKKILGFQYGDALNDAGDYDLIDPEKQIIKQTAIVGNNGTVVVKIATLTNDVLSPLTDQAQIDAFTEYVRLISMVGQEYEIVNEPADNLRVDLNLYYDPIKMTSEGYLIALDDNVNQIEKAINEYLESLDFNGSLYVNDLEDYIQRVEGVNDVHALKCFSAIGNTPFTEIDRVYFPFSGYMNLIELNINFYAGQ